MSENIYYQDQPGLFSSAILPLGSLVGDHYALRSVLGKRAGLLGTMRNPFSNRKKRAVLRGRMSQASGSAWSAMLRQGGGNLSERFAAARRGVEWAAGGGRVRAASHGFRTPGGVAGSGVFRSSSAEVSVSRTLKVTGFDFATGKSTTSVVERAVAPQSSRAALTRASVNRAGMAGIGRTVGALARPLTGTAAAYYTWGWLLPLAAEGFVGGFNELARMGRQLRMSKPETSVGFRDMASRERAFTMRQASMMAIHTSQSGARAALGSEASYLHS